MQDFSLARRAMVDSQLRPEGVTDRGVLAAMGSVERERFVPGKRAGACLFRSAAEVRRRPVDDASRRARPIAVRARAPSRASGRWSSGSGTGYSAALLKAIGLEVVALESDQALAAAAAAGVETVVGDLAKGCGKGAPYDLILLDGAVEEIPDALVKQLARRRQPCRRDHRSGHYAASSSGARPAARLAFAASPTPRSIRFPDSNGLGPSPFDGIRRACL